MKVLTVAVALLLCAGFLAACTPAVTVTPWQYGAIVLVGVSSSQVQTLSSEATQAVNDVAAFWGAPSLTPAANWSSPVQFKPISTSAMGDDEVYNKRIYIFSQSTGRFTVLPPPLWNGKATYPLVIGVYPSVEALDKACGNYTGGAFFSDVYDVSEPLPQALESSPATVLVSQGDCEKGRPLLTLIADWASLLFLTDNFAQENAPDPLLLDYGMSEYAAASLLPGDRWKQLVAQWAESGGGLRDVPCDLQPIVGASVVAYLVGQDGKSAFLKKLPQLAANWDTELQEIAPAWRDSLAGVAISPSDRVLYKARTERLDLCAWLLDPVLPQSASKIVKRIYSDEGTAGDIDRFWQIVSATPPKPSTAIRQRLTYREHSFTLAAREENAHDSEAAAVETKPGTYWNDWPNYYAWFERGVREVVAGLPATEGESPAGS